MDGGFERVLSRVFPIQQMLRDNPISQAAYEGAVFGSDHRQLPAHSESAAARVAQAVAVAACRS